MNVKLNDSFENESQALSRLKEALDRDANDDVVRDAAIQRFEFCFELMWKLLGRILSQEGITTSYPKEILQKAYSARLIDDEAVWLAMLKDRNLTSHTYKQALAIEIYGHIKQYYQVMRSTFDRLYEKYYNKGK